MILCDTNILIEFYKNNTAIIQELRQIGIHQLVISAIARFDRVQVFFELAGLWENKGINTNYLHIEA